MLNKLSLCILTHVYLNIIITMEKIILNVVDLQAS